MHRYIKGLCNDGGYLYAYQDDTEVQPKLRVFDLQVEM
jgi:hypothetical protein